MLLFWWNIVGAASAVFLFFALGAALSILVRFFVFLTQAVDLISGVFRNALTDVLENDQHEFELFFIEVNGFEMNTLPEPSFGYEDLPPQRVAKEAKYIDIQLLVDFRIMNIVENHLYELVNIAQILPRQILDIPIERLALRDVLRVGDDF